MKLSLLLLSLVASANAFTTPMAIKATFVSSSLPSNNRMTLMMAQENEEPSDLASPAIIPAFTAAFWTLTSSAAMADSPDWGIFEGRTGSLLHPLMMGGLLLFSVKTALLGFDWRRQRTIGDEISELKKRIPDLGGASTVSAAITAAREADDSALVSKLQAALPVEEEIKALQDERKELAAKGPRDQHYSQGALLVFLGTLFAIEVRPISCQKERVECRSWFGMSPTLKLFFATT